MVNVKKGNFGVKFIFQVNIECDITGDNMFRYHVESKERLLRAVEKFSYLSDGDAECCWGKLK